MHKKVLLIISILLLSFVSVANQELELIEVDIAVEGQHEECFYIDTNTKIRYQFNTTKPVDFNLHFHDDKGMNYLIEIEKTNKDKQLVDKLVPEQVYCLMWQNSSATKNELTYSFIMEP